MEVAEILLRKTIFEEYKENAVQITIEYLQDLLTELPGVWWNAYSMTYGLLIKPFPYKARNGYFVDVGKRVATHRFESKGIVRRDKILSDKEYLQIVPEPYRDLWFDWDDAVRTYSVIISKIDKLDNPIEVEKFGLYKSWGKVSPKDRFQRPRLIRPILPE